MCGGVRIWSLYVPNGRKVDDPHYVYKLDWLARLREAAQGWLGEDTALVGDWNIAPLDEDVFDMTQFAKSTHVTPPERAAFQAFLDDGYVDVVRPHTPGPEVYTYWDYYRQRFERNRGLRIDFVLGSPSLAERVTGAFIDRDERAGTGASDHAPVLVDVPMSGPSRRTRLRRPPPGDRAPQALVGRLVPPQLPGAAGRLPAARLRRPRSPATSASTPTAASGWPTASCPTRRSSTAPARWPT